MTESRLSPEVEAFIAETASTVRVSGGELEIVVNREVSFSVHLRGDVFTVEMVERGRSNGTDLATEDLGVLERYLVLLVASSWREKHGMGRLLTSSLPATPLEVVHDPPDGFVVREPDGSRTYASQLISLEARRLAAVIPHPVDAVLAAARDPDGHPLV